MNVTQENPSASKRPLQTNQMKGIIASDRVWNVQMKKSIFKCKNSIRINNGRTTNTLWLLHLHTSFMFNLLHNAAVGAPGPILIIKVA